MGRKRKEDVILDLLPSSDRDPSGPGTSNRAPKRANHPKIFRGADVRGFERPTSDIMREYVNLLLAGAGYDGTPYKWLSARPTACFVMRKHVEDKPLRGRVGKKFTLI
jgi:hypothetical protein